MARPTHLRKGKRAARLAARGAARFAVARLTRRHFIPFPFFFCSLYNNILAPSKLIHGTDFHLFKEGIEPKWEDPKCATHARGGVSRVRRLTAVAPPRRCAKGGKWTFNVPKTSARQPLDTLWLNMLLARPHPPTHPRLPAAPPHARMPARTDTRTDALLFAACRLSLTTTNNNQPARP